MTQKGHNTGKNKCDPSARGWLITINNNAKYGYTHQKVKELLSSIQLDYYSMADEIGNNGTPHIHIYIYRASSSIKFSTLKNLFHEANLLACDKPPECADTYVQKGGSWKDSPKYETRVEGSYESWGVLPVRGQENERIEVHVMALFETGYKVRDVIRIYPHLALRINSLTDLREEMLKAKYNDNRAVQVLYIHGKTGVGKTRYLYDFYDDVCRMTYYDNPMKFDIYDGHKVLAFDEFYGQIAIEPLLTWIDRYPVNLPARYRYRTACFETVIFLSNVPLSELYIAEQNKRPEVWAALLRRIDRIYEMQSGGILIDETEAYKEIQNDKE